MTQQKVRKRPTADQLNRFKEDGFLVVDDLISIELAQQVAERFAPMFRGEFATTVPPDEWRWCEGRDPLDVTRMIWNGWKSDLCIARLALDEIVGEWCARLAGWNGARLNQDGCLWKPPGAAGLAFHQDAIYNQWIVPAEVITCWLPLDDVSGENGGIEYVKGSHRWGTGMKPTDFHKPQDHQAMVKEAARAIGKDCEIVSPTLKVGGATFHHGWLWHGSGPNMTDTHRRVLALHCMPKDVAFHPTNPAYAQGRYRRFDTVAMDESHYPIIWGEDGQRSRFIDGYLSSSTIEYRSHSWT